MNTTPTRPRQPPCHPSGRPAFANLEPELREILADPIVRTLMARDGVGIGDIRYLAALLRDRCRCGGAPAQIISKSGPPRGADSKRLSP